MLNTTFTYTNGEKRKYLTSQHNCKNKYLFWSLVQQTNPLWESQSCYWQPASDGINTTQTQTEAVVPAQSVFPAVSDLSTYVLCNADPGLRLAAVNPFARLRGSLCPGWELVFGEGDLPASTDNVLAELAKDCLQACIKHLDGTYQPLILPQPSLLRKHGQGFDMELRKAAFDWLSVLGRYWTVCVCVHIQHNLWACTSVEKKMELEAESKWKSGRKK